MLIKADYIGRFTYDKEKSCDEIREEIFERFKNTPFYLEYRNYILIFVGDYVNLYLIQI